MDALSDDRGQALVISVLLLGIAAVAITGLRAAQEHIVATVREGRAGEAAVEAATAVFADSYAAEARESGPPSLTAIVAALSTRGLRENARAAAQSLSQLNGGGTVSDTTASCANGSVSVALTIAERRYRAGFTAPLCSRH